MQFAECHDIVLWFVSRAALDSQPADLVFQSGSLSTSGIKKMRSQQNVVLGMRERRSCPLHAFWRCSAAGLSPQLLFTTCLKGAVERGVGGITETGSLCFRPPGPRRRKKKLSLPPQQSRRLVGKLWRLVGKLTISWAGKESLWHRRA